MYKIVLIFLLIFNIPIPVMQSSAILATFLSIPLLKKKNIIITLDFIWLVFTYSIILFITFMFSLLISNDNSLSYAVLKVIIYIFAIYITLFSFDDSDDIIKIIISAFIIQCILTLLSFISNDFYQITKIFRTSTQIDIHYYSNNIRGNILSSDPFFSTGFLCPIVYFLILKNWNKYKSHFNIISLISVVTLSLFSARTAIIGIVLATFFFVKSMRQMLLIISIVITLGFIVIIFRDSYLFSFIFEPLYNLIYNNKISSDSSDVLLSMLKSFDLSNYLGYGLWINNDGSYYGNTDSGYMRNFYYYGLLSIIIYILFFHLLMRTIKKTSISFITFLILWYLLAHVKGEVIIYPAYANSVFLLIYIWNKKNENN